MKKLVIILTLLFSINFVNSQSIEKHTFANSGELISNATIKLNFTIGEPIIGPISNSNNEVSQGFWNSVTSITLSENDFLQDNLTINVYPNPVTNYVNIKFNASVLQSYHVSIFDVNGRILKKQKLSINSSETQIKMDDLANGIYYLNVKQDNSNKIITYKLIKK
jgi:hypothetical protein